jgi:hypothetical protein
MYQVCSVVLGTGPCQRVLDNAGALLSRYREDTGCAYYDYKPLTPSHRLYLEDIAPTLLVNSRAGWRAAASLIERGDSIDLCSLPGRPLGETSRLDRQKVARLIASVAEWPGFAASLASKVLHKKRPDLIPLLDNQAIFGAYMNPRWPSERAWTASEWREARILEALDWIAGDITREHNYAAWQQLQALEPARTRIELFDSVWWIYFRITEPVRQPATRRRASAALGSW